MNTIPQHVSHLWGNSPVITLIYGGGWGMPLISWRNKSSVITGYKAIKQYSSTI